MIVNFDQEDIDDLLDTTFFLILEYWSVSNETSRRLMEAMIMDVFERRIPAMSNQTVYRIPLLSKVPDLQKYEDMLGKVREPVDASTAFAIFADRLGHEHSGVVLLTLSELVEYLKESQEYLQTSAISEHPDPVVSRLLRGVLDCASRHHGVNIEVARLCIEAIGLIGCVDPNRIDAARVPKKVVLVDNFGTEDDRQQFGFFVLSEVLVKSFLAATDTGWQGVLSFAMQELLERCDIKAAILQEDGGRRGAPTTELFRKWRELPTTVQEVLSPFLSSRYALKPMRQMNVEYPIFRPGMTYSVWLRTFVLHLLRNPQHANATLVFEPLCRVIRAKDLSVADFLLPYAVLHIILSESAPRQLQQNVSNELSVILDYELPSTATPAEKHEMKLLYEVCEPSRMSWTLLTRCRHSSGHSTTS
jgi:serine/threonine-protein kinase ATR